MLSEPISFIIKGFFPTPFCKDQEIIYRVLEFVEGSKFSKGRRLLQFVVHDLRHIYILFLRANKTVSLLEYRIVTSKMAL